MIILVLNCGSSSLKFQFIDTDAEKMARGDDGCLVKGTLERIGTQSLVTIRVPGRQRFHTALPLRSHRDAIDYVLKWVLSDENRIGAISSLGDIVAVGHRVVHGGEHFSRSMIVNAQVIKAIQSCSELAPLHNPANLLGIEAVRDLLGDSVSQVAVFDTAFHAEMPETSFLYALPYHYYARYKVRRYGFHGMSHRYVSERWRQITGRTESETNIITMHLGNGCSACAISGGKSMDTSMGMTPTEGLVMGTRSGDLDPSILEYLHHKEGFTFSEFTRILNKESGLAGVSGLTNDMRELVYEMEHNKDRRATLAIDMFCTRAKKYIGAYLALLNGCKALVFTGGIGENNVFIRKRILTGLESLGLVIDHAKNDACEGSEGEISAPESAIKIYVVPTNEELVIARDTFQSVAAAGRT
jgi:acetate kinase